MTAHGPYSLPNPFSSALPRAAAGVCIRAVERLLALGHLNQTYFAGAAATDTEHFSDAALRFLGASYDVSSDDLRRIPHTGPLIAVANHPFGGVDGLVLNALLRRARTDVKLFGSVMLQRMEAYRADFFFVDNFGAPDAPSRNIAATKAALRWLKEGKCIGVFPAGEVSHLTWKDRIIADPPWSTLIARLAQTSGASVLPIYFDGHNSRLFQLAGLLHPRLRTILLAREVKRCRNKTLRVCVGSVIPPGRIAQFESPEKLNDYLRLRTYVLRGRIGSSPAAALARRERLSRRVEQAIVPAEPTDRLEQELNDLPARHTLASLGDFRVLYTSAAASPAVLREIGRLRELTFRGVGEGTGRARDLDEFDADYLHLLVWSNDSKQIVGAYRLELSDEILARRGIAGLYTSTLFRYDRALLDQIGPAIELGRSFIRPEFQRDYAPLMLLWRGIARFIAAHPKYKMLFGPVSISNDYHSLSKQLLMEFLSHNGASPDLQKLITPRNPPRLGKFRGIEAKLAATAVRDVRNLDDILAEIEADRLSMPILLRQYLKLNARLLAFNVDPDFGDVLDGLMLADLTTVDRAMLVRYMGRDEAAQFLAFHGIG